MAVGDYLVGVMEVLSTAELREIFREAMFTDTEDGAYFTAFAFLQQASEVFVTRNASVLRSLSGPECGWCTERWRLVLDSASMNIRITGGEYLMDDDFLGHRIEGGNVIFETGATRMEAVLWNHDGTAYERTAEVRVTIRMELAFRDGQWFVEGVSVE